MHNSRPGRKVGKKIFRLFFFHSSGSFPGILGYIYYIDDDNDKVYQSNYQLFLGMWCFSKILINNQAHLVACIHYLYQRSKGDIVIFFAEYEKKKSVVPPQRQLLCEDIRRNGQKNLKKAQLHPPCKMVAMDARARLLESIQNRVTNPELVQEKKEEQEEKFEKKKEEQVFAKAFNEILCMGFEDRVKIHQALKRYDFDVTKAVEELIYNCWKRK